MHERVIIAGSGGQGVMLMGRLLAQAMMEQGKEVTYFPSYGTEVRGGTAHCHVIIADDEIFSPVVEHADAAIIMNQPSYEKFKDRIAENGLVILNASLAKASASNNCVETIEIPATEAASELGDVRVANMVALGAYNACRGHLSVDELLGVMKGALKGKGADIVAVNQKALEKGAELASAN